MGKLMLRNSFSPFKQTTTTMIDKQSEEAARTIPPGKKFRIEIEDPEVKTHDRSIVSKILWIERRGGKEFSGNIQGMAASDTLSSL